MHSKKKLRGKCPKCQTVNVSATSTFKCRRCGFELQIRGKNAAKERRLFALSLLPVLMVVAAIGLFVLLLVKPEPVMRMLGYGEAVPLRELIESARDRSSKSEEFVELSPEEIFKKRRPAVVTLACLNEDDENTSVGSGFFIKYELPDNEDIEPSKEGTIGYVLTNEHVSEKGSSIVVISGGLPIGTVNRVILEDAEADLALLEVEVNRSVALPDPLTITEADPSVGSTVYAIGSPYGLEQSFSKGMVSGLRKWSTTARRLQTTSLVDPGSSGGPILNDFGQVVGVASQSIKGTEIDFAVPPQSIHDMLARTPAPKVPSYGRSCSKEVLQTLQRLDRSASCEKDSRAKVFKEQLLLAAAVADESPGKAIEVLRPLLDNMPTEWKFFAEYILGKAHCDLLPASSSGKLEDVADLARGKQAEELLEGSMKSNREFMSSQLEYCKLMIRLEDYQGGLEVAKFFAKSSPKCCEAHLILAEIHDLLGNAKEALQSYAFALLVDPVSKRNQDRFVKFLRDNDDSHDAKVLFLTEQSVSSGDKKGVWSFILGMVHQEYKDYDKAFKAFEDAIADGVPFGQKVFERMEAIRKATRAPE